MAEGLSINSVLNLDVDRAINQAKKFARKPVKVNLVIPSGDIFKEINRQAIKPIKINVDRTNIDQLIHDLNLPVTIKTQVNSGAVRSTIQSALSEPFDIAISSNVTTQLEASAQSIGEIFSGELKSALSNIKVQQDDGGLLGGLVGLAASPIKAITRGFQEGIGLTAAQEIFSGTIKGIEKEFDIAFDKIGQKTGETLGKTGQGVADFTLKSLGTSSEQVLTVFEELKVGWSDIWDAEKAERQIDRIAGSINTLLVDLIDKKPSIVLKTDLQEIGEEIKRYQGLAREGMDFKKQVNVIDAAKSAQQASEGIEVGQTQKQGVVLVGSGFGKKSEAQANAEQLATYLQGLVGDLVEIVPLANEAIATNKAAGENTPIWLAEVLSKLTEFNVIGKANTDAIQMAATAMAIRRASSNPSSVA